MGKGRVCMKVGDKGGGYQWEGRSEEGCEGRGAKCG